MPVYPHHDLPLSEVPRIRTRVLCGPQVGAVETAIWQQWIEPGGFIPLHYHEVEEVLLITAGTIQLTLGDQVSNVAASLVNNAGFNCVTTRVVVTWRGWKQRELFLGELKAALKQVPQRVPYYPGTCQRFEEFTGEAPEQAENGSLAWLLVEDADPVQVPLMFADESFVPASAEFRLDAESPGEFLTRAAEFCNDRLFGTLSAAITMPNAFRRQQQPLVENVISQLNYGSVCINQWPGLVYGLMTPPWGAAPGSTLENIQSGIGSVHNLYFLEQFQKTVFRGPLCNFPKPIWFPSHQRSEKIAWKLLRFYGHPGASKLPGLFIPALLG